MHGTSSSLKIRAFSVTNGADSYRGLYRLLFNNDLQKAAIRGRRQIALAFSTRDFHHDLTYTASFVSSVCVGLKKNGEEM